GKDLEATQATLSLHGMQVRGSGGDDLDSKHVHGHLEGNNLVLSKFQRFAQARPNMDGTLPFVADANGTIEEPGLKATAKLTRIVADGNALGEVSAEMHSDAD